MNWYEYLSGQLIGGHDELFNVETAFKYYSMNNKTDIYKYSFNLNIKHLKLIKTIIHKNFKFSTIHNYNIDIVSTPVDIDEGDDMLIFYSAETYISGFTHNGIDYYFTIFTTNQKTKDVLVAKFRESINMDEALR